jgi:hypothetical protein
MAETDSWTGSIAERTALEINVGEFLRTHRNGWSMLIDWLHSIPPDRTEAEYVEECAQRASRDASDRQAALDGENQRRAARGEPPIDMKGNIVGT